MEFIAPGTNEQNPDTTLRMIKTYWAFRLATWTLVGNAVGSLAVLAWYWKRLPPAVPLWYSRPWGEERLAHPAFLLVLVFGSIAVYLINLFVSVYITSEHPTFTKTLLLTSTLVNSLAFVAVARILTLVT